MYSLYYKKYFIMLSPSVYSVSALLIYRSLVIPKAIKYCIFNIYINSSISERLFLNLSKNYWLFLAWYSKLKIVLKFEIKICHIEPMKMALKDIIHFHHRLLLINNIILILLLTSVGRKSCQEY